LCVSQDEIHRVVTLDTSGTTGEPKRIYFTREDQELTIDFFNVGMSTFTTPGDRVLILLPGDRAGSVGDLLTLGLGRLGALGIKHGPGIPEPITLQRLADENANGMVGAPTQVLALARQPGANKIKLKSVLLSTDHVPNAIVRAIENVFGCAVYNHYGMTEMGLGGGVECEARRGYHLREADMFFEVINPRTGQPAPDGEEGEVVFTTLTRRGMPLIRYRTGDLSAFLPAQCACGAALKNLARITTRVDGFVPFGGSFLTMPELDEAIFPVDGVTNFAATILPNELRIEARVIPSYEEFASARIRAALGSIPKIASAGAKLTVLASPALAPGKIVKRKIVHQTGLESGLSVDHSQKEIRDE
jgi:phenylacetate-coenzyme A ligase PaaK-like adenylate-forming protein